MVVCRRADVHVRMQGCGYREHPIAQVANYHGHNLALEAWRVGRSSPN